MDFVVSFGVGVALVTAFGWACLTAASASRVAFKRPSLRLGLRPSPDDGATDGRGDETRAAAPCAHLTVRDLACAVAAGLPSMRPRLLFVPGMLAGVAWSAGNFASMVATLQLGEAVGYSACQAAVLVSGLWGLLYFGEAPRGGPQWFAGAVSCTGGIVLLAMVTK